MSTRYATQDEVERWDEHLAANPDGGNVFQMCEMAEAKAANGWKPRYIICGDLAITALEKHVPLLGRFWYLPKGPGVTDAATLQTIVTPLREFAHKQGVFVVKIEPEIIESSEATTAFAETDFLPVSPIQPNHSTVIVDLAPQLDDIMASLNQKGRNALRRAQREGVTTRAVPLTDETMQTMYTLLSSTAAGRFDASLRSFAYYKAFWQRYVDTNHGSLFFAEYDGTVIAAAFCMYIGKKGLYKDGASLRDKVVYGASHLLQWQVIQWLKERGVTSYDLCGSPHSSQISNTNNPFYGIGKFKTSFNKHVTDYIGCYDVVIHPRAYRLWKRIGERIALSLSWRLKHRQWY